MRKLMIIGIIFVLIVWLLVTYFAFHLNYDFESLLVQDVVDSDTMATVHYLFFISVLGSIISGIAWIAMIMVLVIYWAEFK